MVIGWGRKLQKLYRYARRGCVSAQALSALIRFKLPMTSPMGSFKNQL